MTMHLQSPHATAVPFGELQVGCCCMLPQWNLNLTVTLTLNLFSSVDNYHEKLGKTPLKTFAHESPILT